MTEDQQQDEQAQPAPDEYAMVEVFGHRRHVGRILEVERFGTKLLRVDVPNDGDWSKGYVSHFYGGAAIFSLTLCSPEAVRRANEPTHRPAGHYQLAAPEDDDDDGGESIFG